MKRYAEKKKKLSQLKKNHLILLRKSFDLTEVNPRLLFLRRVFSYAFDESSNYKISCYVWSRQVFKYLFT